MIPFFLSIENRRLESVAQVTETDAFTATDTEPPVTATDTDFITATDTEPPFTATDTEPPFTATDTEPPFTSTDTEPPFTATDTDFVTATDAPPFSGALVTKSDTQANVNLSSTPTITWTLEAYDYGDWFDSGVSTTRLTVPSGVSRVRVSAGFAVANHNVAVATQIQIRKNGTSDYIGSAVFSAQAPIPNPRQNTRTAVLDVTPGDYFELAAFSADTLVDILALRTWFSIEKVE